MALSRIGHKRVSSGHANNNADRVLVSKMAVRCNANQMYFAMHVHYIKVNDALTAITDLVDVSAPWDVPNWRMATEVGVAADFPDLPEYAGDSWWSEVPGEPFVTNLMIHNRFFAGDDDPPETWEHFVDRWESESRSFGTQHQQNPGFRLDDVCDEFAENGFAAICWPALQYDPGTPGSPSPFLVGALRGTQVRSGTFFESGNGTNRFTPLKSAYLTASADYKITSFSPHDTACDTEVTCPSCQ